MSRTLSALSLLILSFAAASACGGGGGGGAGANSAQQAQGANAARIADESSQKSDVDFARETLKRLAEGDASVEEAFDWDNFAAFGEDFGADYRNMPEPERAEERRDFIEGFSREFKGAGGDFSKTGNWREESKDAQGTVVAVDYPTGATLFATVAQRDGRRVISRLEAKGPAESER